MSEQARAHNKLRTPLQDGTPVKLDIWGINP